MKWSGPALVLLSVVGHDPARPRLMFRMVSAGASHTCGVAAGGVAYCWGDNTAGELGTGDGRSHMKPAAVSGHLTFASLSARSEERRVGKECRTRWSTDRHKQNEVVDKHT